MYPHDRQDAIANILVDGAGDRTLVFLHGWPDTARLWWRQVAAFRGRYRCVRITLPGFEGGSRRAYGFDDVVERLEHVLDVTCPGELELRPGSRVVALPAGHWMMIAEPDAFNAAVLAWLEDAW